MPDVVISELVLVALMDKLLRGVDEEDVGICLALLQHDDAGGDGDTEKQVVGQLDDSVDKVVAYQIASDFLLGTPAVEHAGELYDGRRAVGGEPREHVHGEGQVCLALRSQHTGGSKTLVVDKDGVGVAFPLDAIWGIGHDGVERLIIPVLRVFKRVAELDVELVEAHAMQEHVDAAEVVSCRVDLLTVERRTLLAHDLLELEQQRTRAAGGVVSLLDFLLVADGYLRQQTAHLLGCEELTAALTRIAGIHHHQKLVSVAEGIVDGLVESIAEVEVSDGIENLHQFLIALLMSCSESLPFAEFSIWLKILPSVMLRFSS